MAGSPVTRQEALQYDATALRLDTGKREHNIKIFENTILAENAGIEREEYMISQIDPKHSDVKLLRANIAKKKVNIKTFELAIKEEKVQIERDLKMIKIIEKNKISN